MEHGQYERARLFPFEVKYVMMLHARYAQFGTTLQKDSCPRFSISNRLEAGIQKGALGHRLFGSPFVQYEQMWLEANMFVNEQPLLIGKPDSP